MTRATRRLATIAFSAAGLFPLFAAIPPWDRPVIAADLGAPTEAHAAPVDFRVSRDGGRIKLKGQPPSEADRAAVLGIAKARFPQAEIVDRMKLGNRSVDPAAWRSGVSLVLRIASHLHQGDVALKSGAVHVSGTAVNTANYAAIEAALATNVPPGFRAGPTKLNKAEKAGYSWAAQATDHGLAMSGKVPSMEAQSILERLASELFPGTVLINAMEIVKDGVPEHYLQATAQALKLLRFLDSGQVRLADSVVKVEGQAANAATASIISSLLDDFPSGYTVDHNIARGRVRADTPLRGDVTGGLSPAFSGTELRK